MSQHIQEEFLNNLSNNKVSVTVFLVNGVKLQGLITYFDEQSLLLLPRRPYQLIYKHAVSTIMPGTAVEIEPQTTEA